MLRITCGKHWSLLLVLVYAHKNNNNTEAICSAHISTLLGAQGANPETPGQVPFSFTISVLGSFTCITQHTGPTALRPIRRTKQLRLSVLLKDTSAATGQARIRTHILTTPELESNALNRSATTLPSCIFTGALFVLLSNLSSIIAFNGVVQFQNTQICWIGLGIKSTCILFC